MAEQIRWNEEKHLKSLAAECEISKTSLSPSFVPIVCADLLAQKSARGTPPRGLIFSLGKRPISKL